MTIRPTQPGDGQRPGLGRVSRQVPSAPAPAPAAGPGPSRGPESAEFRADEVEISSTARELTEQLATSSSSLSSLEPGRLRQVLGRIASGHYDLPQVRDEVLKKLIGDL